jgi:hypothetical protein
MTVRPAHTDVMATDAWARGVAKAKAAMAQGKADLADAEGTVSVSTDGGPANFYRRVHFKLCTTCGWGTDTKQHQAHVAAQ